MVWPKVQDKRVGEAEPELGRVVGGQAAAAGPAAPAGQPAGQTVMVGLTSVHKFLWVGSFGFLVGSVESVGQIRWGLEWEEVLVVILVSRWREGILPVVEHVSSVVGGEVAGLCPEVQENGIGFPAAEGWYSSFVHSRDEESGGAPGAEAVGDDAVGRDVRDVLDRGGGGSECSGDVARGDVVGIARGIEVTVQWAVGWCVVLAKVKDTALGRPDWAESVVARAAVAKGLALCCILLVGVGETDVSPFLHVI
jgi:hypothetical protein